MAVDGDAFGSEENEKLPRSGAVKGSPSSWRYDLWVKGAAISGQTDGRRVEWWTHRRGIKRAGRQPGAHCRRGTILSALDGGRSPSRKMQSRHVDTRRDGWTRLTNGCRRGGRPTERAGPSGRLPDHRQRRRRSVYHPRRSATTIRHAHWPDHPASDKCWSVIWDGDGCPARPGRRGKTRFCCQQRDSCRAAQSTSCCAWRLMRTIGDRSTKIDVWPNDVRHNNGVNMISL